MEVMHPLFFPQKLQLQLQWNWHIPWVCPLQISDHFPVSFIISTIFPPLREMKYSSRVKLIAALDAHCVSAHRRPRNGVLEVHRSGGHRRWKMEDAKSGL